jgi:hypothetical protein
MAKEERTLKAIHRKNFDKDILLLLLRTPCPMFQLKM